MKLNSWDDRNGTITHQGPPTVADDPPDPIVNEVPDIHQQLGEIAIQARNPIEIQASRGVHKYGEELEYVERCPIVHYYLDLRYRMYQCLALKKRGKPVGGVGSATVVGIF